LQPTFIPVPIEPQVKGRVDGDSIEAQSKRLNRRTHDPRSAEKDSRVLNRVEREDRESGVEQLSVTAPEGTSDDGLDGLDAHGLVRSERSKGECRHSTSSNATTRVDHYQLGREAGLTGPSGVSRLRSMSPKGQPKHSLP